MKPHKQLWMLRNRITVETAIWAALVLVALGLRIANLDAAPLSQAEAREALAAWRAVASQGTSPDSRAEALSPALFAGNALLFAVLGATDASARVLPALFGAGLVLTPRLLQPRIGRFGGLAAGVYLAISPTALVASRQMDGSVLAAVGCMFVLGGIVQAAETKRARWLALAGTGFSLSMSASPLAYASFVPLSLACAAAA